MKNTCPYKLLGISPGCSLTRPIATEAFEQLNEAYHLLSGPKTHKFIFKDLNLSEAYFPPNDQQEGLDFFAYYDKIFTEVYRQEVNYVFFNNSDSYKMKIETPSPPPPLGNADSSNDVVSAFYDYWMMFSTVLEFEWAGEAARWEYEKSVHDLVWFMWSIDKRVIVDYEDREEEKKRAAREKWMAKSNEKENAKAKVKEEDKTKEKVEKWVAKHPEQTLTKVDVKGLETTAGVCTPFAQPPSTMAEVEEVKRCITAKEFFYVYVGAVAFMCICLAVAIGLALNEGAESIASVNVFEVFAYASGTFLIAGLLVWNLW